MENGTFSTYNFVADGFDFDPSPLPFFATSNKLFPPSCLEASTCRAYAFSIASFLSWLCCLYAFNL